MTSKTKTLTPARRKALEAKYAAEAEVFKRRALACVPIVDTDLPTIYDALEDAYYSLYCEPLALDEMHSLMQTVMVYADHLMLEAHRRFFTAKPMANLVYSGLKLDLAVMKRHADAGKIAVNGLNYRFALEIIPSITQLWKTITLRLDITEGE